MKGMVIGMIIRKKWRIYILAILVIGVVSASIFFISKNSKASKLYAVPVLSEVFYEETYQKYLEDNEFDGTLADGEVVIDLSKYTAHEDMEVEIGQEGLLTGASGSISWDFNVEEAGFYNLEVGYIALPGTYSDIQRKILLDGVICHDGLQQIVFKRWWSDETIITKNKNEIRPNAKEIYKETKVFIEDYNRRVGEPILFYLSKGKHTLTFEVIKEPIQYTSIVFKAADKPDSYKSKINTLKNNYPVNDDIIISQAERSEGSTLFIEKSSPSINIKTNYSDSRLVPYHPYRIVYNTIGADSWKQPGDLITWVIEVEEEGLYPITFKGRQSLQRGVTSYRRLYINGEVPYQEMNSIGFGYSSNMVNYTIADEKGEPYLFYLKKGANTITLENVLGGLGGILYEVEDSMQKLNNLYLKVIQITGQTPYKYIDYQITKKIPQFVETMENESQRLFNLVDTMVEITGEKGENTSLLEKMAMEAAWLADDPESVIEELNQLKNNISALGTWLVSISEMPLEIDAVIIGGDLKSLPKPKDNIFESIYYGVVRFFSTFFVKSNQIDADEVVSDEAIKVWMTTSASTGREQAQIIQNMIDESFSPNTGIQVNLQLIPVDVVLRAALAGDGPDVVIGLGQGTLQDFAMRNAITDLTIFDDFEEVTEKFHESAIQCAMYQGGVYGLPEQENFMMLFYRKDILDELGLTIPNTWDDVREMIPVLKKSNYDFYLPSNMNLYSSMVYQYGGDLYRGEGNDYGISSALYDDEAMIAFKDFTDFFTSYGLLVSADFSNRFRTGEMPIGITNYTTYCQLEIFAPEIKGLWSFAPLPGVQKEDGFIDRTYIADTVQSVIMKGCKNLDDSWEFLKWWTSTDSQLQYANTLEAIMGTAARYAAADPGVISMLPWSNAELKQLLGQLEHNIGLQAVPGNYMTARMIQYAFNTVVAELSNPRETLYLNIKAIDKELYKKRMEFNLSLNPLLVTK